MSDEIPAAVQQARVLLPPALRRAVDQLSAPMRAIAGYQLGCLTADGAPRPADGGKRIRGALALLSAQAAGRSPEEGLPAAIAVELVHEFSLMHDDVMDGDELRRHQPAAWTVFGSSAAILGGVAILARAQLVLLEVSGPGWARATRRLTDAVADLVAGQAADLALEHRADATVDECLAMVAGKTAALLGCAASLGAVGVGGPPDLEHALRSYGHQLGLAFQLVDDLLGLWGDPDRTGKPVGSDLRAGGPAAHRLAELLAELAPADEEGCALAAKLIEDAGGRRWAEAEARRRLGFALAAVDAVPMPEAARAGLHEVAQFVVARDL